MNRWTGRAAVVGTVLGLALTTAVPAVAGGDDVEQRGSCKGTGDSNWRLRVKEDDGRLEVEGRVYSGRAGQRWNWKILHDGDVSFQGRARTYGSSGKLEVERQVVDVSGYDAIGWRARNPHTGERCRGHVGL